MKFRSKNSPLSIHISSKLKEQPILKNQLLLFALPVLVTQAHVLVSTQWAESEDTVIILTSGYLPPDSPLKLAKEKRFFRLDGEKIPVHANFEQIELSGHADQAEIIQLIEKMKPKKTFCAWRLRTSRSAFQGNFRND